MTKKSSGVIFWHRKPQESIDWKKFLESRTISYGGVTLGDAKTINQNRDRLITIFRELDKDGNGSLSLDEFEAGVAKLNKTLPKEKQLTHTVDLFNALDLDHNGEITFEEFEQGCSQSNSNNFGALVGHQAEVLHECREMLLTVFKFLDTDGSGSIDAAELGTVMKSLGVDTTAEELEAMLETADADGSGEIDFNEFLALMTEKIGTEGEERLRNAKVAFWALQSYKFRAADGSSSEWLCIGELQELITAGKLQDASEIL